ncbi:hypothetical protein EBR43_05820 [bacterium]|nr:hypothetical protein [bacterium]
MPNVPTYTDLQRQKRNAVNNRLSLKSVLNNGSPVAQSVAAPAPVPEYQKNGWYLSFSVTMSASNINLDTKNLIIFNPGVPDATYGNAPYTNLRYANYAGVDRWFVETLGTVSFYLSTLNDVAYLKTPSTVEPMDSGAGWVATGQSVLSSLYVKANY